MVISEKKRVNTRVRVYAQAKRKVSRRTDFNVLTHILQKDVWSQLHMQIVSDEKFALLTRWIEIGCPEKFVKPDGAKGGAPPLLWLSEPRHNGRTRSVSGRPTQCELYSVGLYTHWSE